MARMTEAEEKLAAVKMWADANATMTHVAEFPEVLGERQQEEMERLHDVLVDRILVSLGFMAGSFMDSTEGRIVLQRIEKSLAAAYKLGLEDGKNAHYESMRKNQDAFMGAFFKGLVGQVEEITKDAK